LLLVLEEKRRALTQGGKHRLGELLEPVLLRLSLTKQGLLQTKLTLLLLTLEETQRLLLKLLLTLGKSLLLTLELRLLLTLGRSLLLTLGRSLLTLTLGKALLLRGLGLCRVSQLLVVSRDAGLELADVTLGVEAQPVALFDTTLKIPTPDVEHD